MYVYCFCEWFEVLLVLICIVLLFGVFNVVEVLIVVYC